MMDEFTDEFMINNRFLYDTYRKEVILEEDKNEESEPERYYEVGVNPIDRDVFTDILWVDRDKNEVISFSYDGKDNWRTNPYFDEMLFAYLKSKGLPRKQYILKKRLYPKERFKRLLEGNYYGVLR